MTLTAVGNVCRKSSENFFFSFTFRCHKTKINNKVFIFMFVSIGINEYIAIALTEDRVKSMSN